MPRLFFFTSRQYPGLHHLFPVFVGVAADHFLKHAAELVRGFVIYVVSFLCTGV